MAGPSTSSSQASSADFSSSRVATNGNNGVVSSVIWLTIATGLCFPWLLEKPSASKAGDSPKAVAWFLMLALDLMIGTVSVFSLWFQKSTLSIMLLIWGSGCILGTFLVGSFAMLPAVATMCCCAPDFCVMGAADTTALDDNFCRQPLELCMETRWSLWCYYIGILLAMVSVVLLVNAVSLHNKTLLECERLRREHVKAARAAHRARRRRQELWEQEVYGGYPANPPQTTHSRSSPTDFTLGNAPTPKVGRDHNSLIAAPAFQSPMFSPSRATAPLADHEMGPAREAGSSPDNVGGDSQLGSGEGSDDVEAGERAGVVAGVVPEVDAVAFDSPTSAPLSLDGGGKRGKDEGFAIGTCSGPNADGGGGVGGGGNCSRRSGIDEDGRMIRSWGRGRRAGEDVMMSWVASDENGGGRITPKTALRFKTSALARVMHN